MTKPIGGDTEVIKGLAYTILKTQSPGAHLLIPIVQAEVTRRFGGRTRVL